MAEPVNHGAHDAVLDLSSRLSYGDYLHLDELLAAQQPRTGAHDEMLFIVQHQTTELWLKLVLHEMDTVLAQVDAGQLRPAFKGLARVERILRQLVSAWDVLATMTPSDYSSFRHGLDTASGFQSMQFRALEFLLGNKDAVYLEPFRHRPDLFVPLRRALHAPSIYDRTLRLLAMRGLPVAGEVLERDWRFPHEMHVSVVSAWRAVYSDTDHYWDLYELAEELIDLEDAMRQWRFRHVTTVERVIGLKRGTGGTSGVQYLRDRTGVVLFPELWAVRTTL